MNELSTAYHEYFEIVAANTAPLLREAFHLRYRIYCQEMHFEDSAHYPDELERDHYDERAVHILLRHRPSGYFVGTVRLVLADPRDPQQPFPIEEFAHFDAEFAPLPVAQRLHSAEISRLAILSRFPHRENKTALSYSLKTGITQPGVPRRRRFPHPVLALGVGIMQASFAHNISHWYAMMDPSLDRLLRHYYLHLQTIGPLFQHHGPRRPHFDSVARVMANAYQHHRAVWELVTNDGKLWPRPDAESSLSVESTPSITPSRQVDPI